jgi:hypothetical protein
MHMRLILRSRGISFFATLTVFAVLTFVVPSLQAQDESALPVSLTDPGPIGAETTTNLYFGQVAVGGGYTTIFSFVNTGSTPVNGTLFLRGQDGTPFNVSIGGVVSNQFPIQPAIPPGGMRVWTVSSVSTTDPTRSGWARLENIGGSVGGVATFQLAQGAVVSTIAGVLPSQPVPFATIPVDNNAAQNRFTGFAVANPNPMSLTLRLVTLDEDGALLDNALPAALSLPPFGQRALFLHEILASRATFRGSMALVAQSGQTFVVTALVVNQGILTVVPAINERAPVVPLN